MQQNMEQIGGIDEGGFLKNFEFKGMTPLSSFDELVANGYDAKANQFIFSTIESYFAMSDDGKGLNKEEAKFMFNMYQRKNREEAIGMANAGAKYACYTLSKKTFNRMISLKDGDYNTIDIEWKKMIQEGKYTQNIGFRTSTPEEVQMFETISKNFTEGRISGVTILFPNTLELQELVQDQFKFHREIDICKSLSFRYGYTRDSFQLKLIDSGETLLQKYNPSNMEKQQKRRIDIMKSRDGKVRYISDRGEEIKPKGSGFSKEPSFTPPDDLEEWNVFNYLEVTMSLPYDENYKEDGSSWFPKEMNIFKGNTKADKLKASRFPVLVRNDYVLGFVVMEEIAVGSARGSYETRQYFDIHMVVSVKQNSTNSIDDILDTQENKGQYIDLKSIQIKRLIHKMKQVFRDEVLNKPKPKPPSKPKPAPPVSSPAPEPPSPEPRSPIHPPPATSPEPPSLPQAPSPEPLHEPPEPQATSPEPLHEPPEPKPVHEILSLPSEPQPEPSLEPPAPSPVPSAPEPPEPSKENRLLSIERIKEHMCQIKLDLKETDCPKKHRLGTQDCLEILGLLESAIHKIELWYEVEYV